MNEDYIAWCIATREQLREAIKKRTDIPMKIGPPGSASDRSAKVMPKLQDTVDHLTRIIEGKD